MGGVIIDTRKIRRAISQDYSINNVPPLNKSRNSYVHDTHVSKIQMNPESQNDPKIEPIPFNPKKSIDDLVLSVTNHNQPYQFKHTLVGVQDYLKNPQLAFEEIGLSLIGMYNDPAFLGVLSYLHEISIAKPFEHQRRPEQNKIKYYMKNILGSYALNGEMDTVKHDIRIAVMTGVIAYRLGLDWESAIQGSFLHSSGHLIIPRNLRDRPYEDFNGHNQHKQILKINNDHALYGTRIAKLIGATELAQIIVYQHHDLNKKQEQTAINDETKILIMGDVYTALRERRSHYKVSFPHDSVVEYFAIRSIQDESHRNEEIAKAVSAENPLATFSFDNIQAELKQNYNSMDRNMLPPLTRMFGYDADRGRDKNPLFNSRISNAFHQLLVELSPSNSNLTRSKHVYQALQ